jgi:tetratricopeptide (TPR) repeat protein
MQAGNLAPASHTARIGQRIRRARLERNLTQGELARGIFSVSYISAVERGQIRPSLVALEQLAVRLQVHVAELLSTEHDAEIDAALAVGEGWALTTDQARGEAASRLREAQSFMRLGRAELAIPILREVIDQNPTPRDLALAHSYLAAISIAQERPEAARLELLEVLSLAERSGDRDLLERSRFELGQVYNRLSQPLLALECHRACYDACQRGIVRDLSFKLDVLNALGEEYLALDASSEAIQALEEAATLSNKVSRREGLGSVFSALADAYLERGDAARAKRNALHSIQSYEEVGARRQGARMHTWLGRAYLESNQLDDAEAHLDMARATAQKLDDSHGLAEAARSLSALHLRRKEYDAAEAHALEALAAGEDDPRLRAEALLALGEVQQSRGKRRDAEKLIRDALESLEGAEPARNLAPAFAHAAALYEERDDTVRALQCMKRAWQSARRRWP